MKIFLKRMFKKVKNILLKIKIEIIVFICYFILLIIIRIIIPNSWILWSLGYESDNEFYYMMAEDITCIFDRIIISPFCYRILEPFLIYILPFDIKLSFTLIGFISYFLIGIMLYLTLRIHFNKIYSILGLILFIIYIECTNNFLYVEFAAVYNVDPLTYLFFICCFYAILKRNKILYAIFLFLGVLTKECILFTIPVFFLYDYYRNYNKFKIKNGIKSFLKNSKYILPAIFSFLLLRLIVIPLPIPEHYVWYMGYHETDYMSFEFFLMMINREIDMFKGDGFSWYIFGAWGILPIFCLFNNTEDIWKWVRIYGIFICCAYIQLIIGKTYFRARFLYVAYYPIIYLSVLGIKRINDLIGNYIQKSKNQIYIIGIKKKKKDFHNNFLFFYIVIVFMIVYYYLFITGVIIIIASLLSFQIVYVFLNFNNMSSEFS
ncbi:MAG: hypothetical protein HWN81_10260 [Candidatus Lokiarchaeota archaeon]|nr:hypothetical protein [Candidatus Lokiarchaeota archaeon]